MRLYIARHGQDEDNAQGVLNGRRNTPLTKVGVEQAHHLGASIKKLNVIPDVILYSPLDRARMTAECIVETTRVSEFYADDLLIERDFGVMTGRLIDDIQKLCSPDIIQTDTICYFTCPEGAETFPELLKRAKLFLKKVENQYSDKIVMAITHGDIGKMIYAAYYQQPWQDVLTEFHFGNSELLVLDTQLDASERRIHTTNQYNH